MAIFQAALGVGDLGHLAARTGIAVTEFTHLHLRTVYSLLDGACDSYKLVDRVAGVEQKSTVMTGHRNEIGCGRRLRLRRR
jgi:hypothetical protein